MELAAQAAFLGRKAHTVGHGLSDICKNIRVKPKSLGQCECENAPALPRTLKSRPTVYPSPSERLPVLKLRNRCVETSKRTQIWRGSPQERVCFRAGQNRQNLPFKTAKSPFIFIGRSGCGKGTQVALL